MEQAKQSDMKVLRPKRRLPSLIGAIFCGLLLVFAGFLVYISFHDISTGDVPYLFSRGYVSSNGEYGQVSSDAAVVIKELDNFDSLGAGDTIAFYYVGARTHHKVYVGQITEVGEDRFEVYVNDTLDAVTVPKDAVRGEATHSIRYLGVFLSIAESRYGRVLTIAIVAVLISGIILLIGDYISALRHRDMVAVLMEAREQSEVLSPEHDDSYTHATEQASRVSLREHQKGFDERAHENEVFEKPMEVSDNTDDERYQAPDTAAETDTEQPMGAMATGTAAEVALKQQAEGFDVDVSVSVRPKEAVENVVHRNEASSAEEQEQKDIDEVLPVNSSTNGEKALLYTEGKPEELQLLQRLIYAAAAQRQKEDIVVLLTNDDKTLHVTCSAEDEPFIDGVIRAFKDRLNGQGA